MYQRWIGKGVIHKIVYVHEKITKNIVYVPDLKTKIEIRSNKIKILF